MGSGMVWDARGGVWRVAPLLPAHAMKTFEIRQPLATHFRVATCAEANCKWYAEGRIVGFDLTDPAKVAAANELARICVDSGLRYQAKTVGTTAQFTFPAKQRCLTSYTRPHRIPLERDPLMIVRGGDWRGNPRREGMRHTSPESFVDHWATDLDKLNTEQERG